MTTPISLRLILRDESTLDRLLAFAASAGWPLIQVVPAGHAMPPQHIWRIDAEHALHYFDDQKLGFRYLLVYGMSPDDIAKRLRAALPCVDIGALLPLWTEADSVMKKSLTLALLAMASGPVLDLRVEEVIRAAMVDPEEAVRLDAIWAAGVTGWPSWREPLIQRVFTDSSERVRSAASGRLAAFRPWSP